MARMRNDLVCPIVNMNGDLVENLMKEHYNCIELLEKAMAAYPRPHGRNYPGDGFSSARYVADEHLLALQKVKAQLEIILEDLSEQRKEMRNRRARAQGT